MGRLVAGIAHEINNPVNAVINTLGPLGEAIAQPWRRAGRGRRRCTGCAAKHERDAAVSSSAARPARKAIVQALHNYSRGDEDCRAT